MQQATITILDPVGLHARPAAVLVQTAGRYQARVRLEHGAKRADARSIIQLLSLGVRQGSAITVVAEGSDEDEALAAVLAVLGREQGPAPEPGHPAAPEADTPITVSNSGSAKKESADEKADQ